MPIAVREDVELYYEVHGAGEPLLLLIGLSFHSQVWFRILPQLKEHFKVILFDNRGVGRSSKPNYPYTTDMFADDTFCVLDAVGVESAHIFGISMGGMIVQRFAAKYPNRVRTLLLGCTSPGGIHQHQPSVESVELFTRYSFRSIDELIEVCIPILYSPVCREKYPDRISEDLACILEYPISSQSFLNQFQACLFHESYDDLSNIQVPTLIFHGEKDVLLPFGNAIVLNDTLPNASLIAFPTAGHMFITEEPDKTIQAVIEFIQAQIPR